MAANAGFLAPPQDAAGTGMQSALLRTAPMATALGWGGQRIMFSVPTYLRNLPDAVIAFRDNPAYICLAAAACTQTGALEGEASRHPKVVAQAVGCGYEEGNVNGAIGNVLAVMAGNLRPMARASLPGDLFTRIRDGVEAHGNAPAVAGIGWLNDPVPDAQVAAPTIVEVHRVMNAIITHDPNIRPNTIRILAHGLLAYCKQGSASQNVINKVTRALQEELGFTVPLDSNTVREVWNMVGAWMNPVKARHFFAIWAQATDGVCLRLNLVVQQASWSSMTNYINIQTAFRRFPDFPWAGLAEIIGEDFVNYQEARELVRDNDLYGYNRDLGNAKSTRYSHLAYAAYNLLRDIGGDQDLRDFQGVKRNLEKAADIDTMITTYRAQRVAGNQQRVQNPGEVARNRAAAVIGALPAPNPAAPRNV